MGGKKSHKARQLEAMQTLSYRQEVYKKKMEEYDQKSLDELKEIFNQKGEKRLGGIYKLALVETVRRKQQELAIAESKVVEETSVDNTETIQDTKD